jgi:hypothetical protein
MASDPDLATPARPTNRRRWLRRVLLFGLLVLVVATVGVWIWAQWIAARKLERAIAEADRLDPVWRLAELLANRRPIPPKTNSAHQVLEAARSIPDGWPDVVEPQPELTEKGLGEGKEPAIEPTGAAAEPLLTGNDLEDAIRKAPPNVALSPRIAKSLDHAVKPLEPAIALARALAGAGEGRYEFSIGEVAIAPDRPHIEAARRVSRLLYLDATRVAEAGNIDEALTSARAIIGVARSVGDEPSDLSQLFRLHQRRSALRAILRALGQGEASDAALAAVQDDLAREASHDLLLCSMRSQRAAYFDTLGKMAEGAYARYAEGDFRAPSFDHAQAKADPITQVFYMRAYGKYNQSLALSILNDAVEGAKYQPFDPRWSQHWEAYERALYDPDRLQQRLGALAYTVLPLNSTMLWMCYESQARFAATRVLLAAERYRRAVGHWPEKLDDVVPKYLAEVPRGPYTDAPIRFIRKDDGVVAYALGMKGHDNGGLLNPEWKREPKYDAGERLWNPEVRRRAADRKSG